MSESPHATAFALVLVTVPDAETGARIGRDLVEAGLAACTSVIPGLRSIYTFEGKLCDDAEALCLIKTRRDLYGRLRDRVEALHPYRVPEIIAVPLSDGNAAYLDWIEEATAAAPRQR